LSVFSPADEQFGVLLAPEQIGQGERVRRMREQAGLRLVQRRQGLLRRVRHRDAGATMQVVPHHPAYDDPA
jgi:hypothetical protein